LRRAHDLVVIEGAGSPAEINLQAYDLVNMRIAHYVNASTLLVCDIDRGGAFAHLYGTHQLLPVEHRRLVRGFVLNKFRGDAGLLAPGPQQLRELTGVPTVGVLPMWREHGLPDEDGVFDAEPSGTGFRIVIVAYPRISNLDEFAALRNLANVSLSWARSAEAVRKADLLIMPGSKHVAADAAWLRERGIGGAIEAHVLAGKPTLAVCGGLQMLGGYIHDPHGVEGAARGLGLLPLQSEFEREKQYQRREYRFSRLEGFWAPLSDFVYGGYEIRHGRSWPDCSRSSEMNLVVPPDCGWQKKQLLALYSHGLFENGVVLRALFGVNARTLEDVFEELANFIERHMDTPTLCSFLQR
jgi:adenosylcobyric acid synthase